jgi:hypothetical protein
MSISGTIGPVGSGSGIFVALSGGTTATTTTDSSGNYTFAGLTSGTYTVAPSKSGYAFSPGGKSVTLNSANATANFQASSQGSVVNISPGQSIPSIVSNSPPGTTFVIAPGTYRLSQSIIPKSGDIFTGQTICAPPTTLCPAVISGSAVIGPLAKFNGTNYEVPGQTQQNPQAATTTNCDPSWLGCIYPEDLYFDGVPYQHLYSPTLPAIGPGQWWFDYTNHVIYFHDNPAGHLVETSVLGNAFGGSANNVTIQYLTVEEFASMYPNGTIGVYQGATPQIQSANWTVQDCEILLNHGYGVRVGYGIQIIDNYIHNNGQVGIGGGLGITSAPATQSMNSGILIQDNIIRYNDYAHFNPDFGAGGIKTGSTAGIVIRGNTIQYNEGSGVHFDDFSGDELLDGNLITDNTDSDGVNQEIGVGTSIFRNNIVLRNGKQVNDSYFTGQITVHATTGVDTYCNIMEVASGFEMNGYVLGASNRGDNAYPPYEFLASTGNQFHHNTVIWDAGATGASGYWQNDATNQPDFFSENSPPDYNTYHLPSLTEAKFVYDNNNSQKNAGTLFAQYQANGADLHGAVDTNYTSGFPIVSIAYPADQSSVTNQLSILALASDPSGISRVEFYVDWVLQTTVTSSPYTFNGRAGLPGLHTLTAMAYSSAGIRNCYAITVNQQ